MNAVIEWPMSGPPWVQRGVALVPTGVLLVRARPRGSWRSNLYEYACAADWLPPVDSGGAGVEEARAWLVRRYLAAFGPAQVDDIRWWTGFPVSEIKKALGALALEVVQVIDPVGQRLLAQETKRLEGSLDGESLSSRTCTPFSRSLEK